MQPYLPIDEAICYAIPLRHRFRGITVREGMILRCGEQWREWSPFTEYGDAEASRWLAAALEDDRPGPVRAQVPINVTVPVVDPDVARRIVAGSHCQTAKVKVADTASSLADDLARLRAVRSELGSHGRIRCDANGAWSLPEALEAISTFAEIGLDYVEQPCATAEELAEVRSQLAERGIPVRIAADESIRRAEDPERVAALNAADVMICKVQPLGGVRRCLDIHQVLGLPVVLSSALETSLGIWAGVQAAAAMPELEGACGLGTVSLLTDDVVKHPLIPRDGVIEVAEPEIDMDALRRVQAPDERQRWWTERLARALEHLHGEHDEGAR